MPFIRTANFGSPSRSSIRLHPKAEINSTHKSVYVRLTALIRAEANIFHPRGRTENREFAFRRAPELLAQQHPPRSPFIPLPPSRKYAAAKDLLPTARVCVYILPSCHTFPQGQLATLLLLARPLVLCCVFECASIYDDLTRAGEEAVIEFWLHRCRVRWCWLVRRRKGRGWKIKQLRERRGVAKICVI